MSDFQLTPEQQEMLEKAKKIFRESENGPPMPENLVRKMQDQAETSAALQGRAPEVPEEDLYDEFLADDDEEEEKEEE